MGQFTSTGVDIASTVLAESERLRALGVDSQRAVKRATGTLARRLKTQARRDIQDEYKLKAKRINWDLRTRNGEGEVQLIGRRRRIGLLQYGARWNPRSAGATVAVRKGEARSTWDGGGAFIAHALGGSPQVFERVGAKRRMTRGYNRGRLKQPLEVQHFGSVADFLLDPARQSRLADFAQEILRKEFDRLITRAMKP